MLWDFNVQFTVANATNTNIVGGYINVYMGPIPGHNNWWAGTAYPKVLQGILEKH